ncbi:MAG TPA: GNAT family N-acetyltransferase [Streptosporangiaceae bacterium]
MDSITAQVARRWHAVDPLLPAPGAPRPDCGERFTVTGADGQPVATATCEHRQVPLESLQASYGATHSFLLTVEVAGPDVAGGLTGLLTAWRDHLASAPAGLPAAVTEDTAAVVSWPSRDVGGVRTLLRHGLAPLSVVAARRAGQAAGGTGPVPDGVRIRRAGPGDEEAVARLGLETVRYDAHFGAVAERPSTLAALRHHATAWLAAPEPWLWLAESEGEQIGMLQAERPAAAAWIAPMTGAAPVSYIPLMFVAPGSRGRGAGAALAARAHAEMEAAGVAVTLLHYEQTNPLSSPFWARQGYRPLWTSWEARPASTLR